MQILLLVFSFTLLSGFDFFAVPAVERSAASLSEMSRQTISGPVVFNASRSRVLPPRSLQLCEALKRYPRMDGEKMPYEIGEISPVCRPFVKAQRKDLDRCGDRQKDPYAAGSTTSQSQTSQSKINKSNTNGAGIGKIRTSESQFTWASRTEMARKGRGNLFADPELQNQLPVLYGRIDQLKVNAARLCCGIDEGCRQQFERVAVSLCRPNDNPNAPDPCVFGGSYKMSGRGYTAIFRAIHKASSESETNELKRLAERNIASEELKDSEQPSGLSSGTIVLSSYISRASGIASLEPVILHELGHACSMVRMQQAALQENPSKALRAVQWLDRARSRCSADVELPDAYFDLWESMGESLGLAQCLLNLTNANLKNQFDRPCSGLCPGHYLEESVGIAFSLLAGELDGSAAAVFPQTCDHVRDGQHPMVSDVAECLTQHSSRFRERLKRTYGCQ